MWTPDQGSRSAHDRRVHRAGIVVAVVTCFGLSACAAAETPPPTSNADANTVAPLPEGALDAGTYLVTGFTVPFEITVPDGWWSGGWIVLNEGAGDWGAYVTFVESEFFVPTDGCQWHNAETLEVDPSLEGFVDALAAQASSATTSPAEVRMGDYSGLEFDISVERDVDLNDCDEASICIFSGQVDTCAHALQQQNQHETARVLDLNGELAFIAGGHSVPDDAALAAEARAVFDSIEFAPDD